MPTFLSTSPASNVVVVTPSDTVDLPVPGGYAAATRGISLAVAGTLTVTTAGGQKVSFASGELLVGTIYGLSVTRIWATGTAATGIKAYY